MKVDDFKNKAFENMLKYAVDEANKQQIDEMSQCEKVEFSKEHEDKMRKLFAGKVKRVKYVKRILIIAAVMVVLFSVSIISVQGFRVKFMNFILSFTETNTELKYADESEDNNSYSVGDIDFAYMPEYLEFNSSRNQGKNICVKFNNNDKYIEIRIREIDAIANVNTEKADAELLMIKGIETFITQKDDVFILSWNNASKTFELMGNIEREELIKIAENVKIK